MSIASEISRLQGAKADIKTAIEGKGVTVPLATKLDGYADLVDAIPQGSTPTGTKQISVTQNGTQTENVSGYASAQLNVSVPNSYSAGDEGKVVSNGALVAQTAHADVTPTTSDQTIDTTANDSIKVKGDADLVASNIKKDVEIFGVTGSYEGGGGGTDNLPAFIMNTMTELIDDSGVITSVVASGCRDRTNLTKVRLKSAATIGGYAFNNCSGIVTIVLPGHTGNLSGGREFQGCSNLEAIDLGGGANIGFSGLANPPWLNCSKFATLIIRKTSGIMTLSPASGVAYTFNGTPFASNGSGGILYVPSSLVDTYKTASNWTTWFADNGNHNNQVKAIEGSYYETHYADGTTIPT